MSPLIENNENGEDFEVPKSGGFAAAFGTEFVYCGGRDSESTSDNCGAWEWLADDEFDDWLAWRPVAPLPHGLSSDACHASDGRRLVVAGGERCN